jgi:hypothetical protein
VEGLEFGVHGCSLRAYLGARFGVWDSWMHIKGLFGWKVWSLGFMDAHYMLIWVEGLEFGVHGCTLRAYLGGRFGVWGSWMHIKGLFGWKVWSLGFMDAH